MQSLLLKLQEIYRLWRNQWEVEASDDWQSFKAFLVRIASVLLLYVILDRVLMKITNLTLENYKEPFIYFAFIKRIFTTWYFMFFISFITILFIFRKNLLCSWTDLSKGKSIRFFVMMAAGILTWVFATYNYNLYFDQGHYIDRFLLFIFLLLIYWRPVFVLPFLTILLPVIWQFAILQGFSFASPFLPIHVLFLFCSFYIIYLLVQKLPIADFVFLMGCLISTHYWVSGFAKSNFDWVLYDQLYFLLPATYANGWLGFLDSSTISSITQQISYFNFPLKILTLILEVGSMFFFLHRHSVKFFLGGWVFFHIGVFFVSGIFFWVWILLDIVFLYLFFKKDGFSTLPIFSKKYLVISMILISTGSFWCKPVLLAWFDVPVSYTYRFVAETKDGNTYLLPPKFFAPFDYQFTLGSFGYLDKKPLMPVVWGASNPSNGKKIMEFDSDKMLYSFEENSGKVYLNEKSQKAFNQFIKQYIQHWNRRYSNQTYLSYIEAPRLLWTFPTYSNFEKSKQPIKRIKVIQILSFYSNGKYNEIRETSVSEISIN